MSMFFHAHIAAGQAVADPAPARADSLMAIVRELMAERRSRRLAAAAPKVEVAPAPCA